jgi:S-adenosylmethionine hydrolase
MKDDERVPAVYFLSDYGTADEFVGIVHAVLHRRAPAVSVIDLSHQIPPFDVEAGAAMLGRCAPHLGAGVVLAVVDPGVGTDRRGVAVETAGDGPRWLIGPDNGLLVPLSAALGGVQRVIALGPAAVGAGPTAASPGGRTFDGRDVFAPAAAHLVLGGSASELGTAADPASLVSVGVDGSGDVRWTTSGGTTRSDASDTGRVGTQPGGSEPGELEARVTWIDRFGNVQLGAGLEALEAIGVAGGGRAHVAVFGSPGLDAVRPVSARRVEAFDDLDEDELGLMADSNGRVAVVLRRASAARRLQPLVVGDTVRISPEWAADCPA